MADQQLIEIAKALSVEARVLILDEPTASLSAHEVERLFAIVRRLARPRRRRPVRQPPPRRGLRSCATGRPCSATGATWSPTATAEPDDGRPRPAHGRSLGHALPEGRRPDRRGPARGPRARPVPGEFRDVELHGPGRRDPRARRARRRGADRDRARPLRHRPARRPARSCSTAGPSTSRRRPRRCVPGIAYVPEDRHQDGLVLDFSIAENVTLPILPRLFPRLFVAARRPSDGSRSEYTEQLDVRMTGVDQLGRALSGGNQQKVVLAKWLATSPRVLILDEPTRGHRHRRQGGGPPDHLRPCRVRAWASS